VSLSGAWGELRLGRDSTPQVYNLFLYDPFSNVGAGASQTFNSIVFTIPTAIRASNSIAWLTPARLGGFYAHAMAWLGESAGNAPAGTRRDGSGAGLRLGYAAGPLDAALAVSRTRYASGDMEQDNAGASWNFGAARLLLQLSRDRMGTTDGRGALVGVAAPVGTGEVKASWSRYRLDAAGPVDPRATKWALGYVHHLSKRTALYATLARVGNAGGSTQAINGAMTAPDAASRGYDLGLRHVF
jgi:predicted porin